MDRLNIDGTTWQLSTTRVQKNAAHFFLETSLRSLI
jgi:hypothetical protein